MLRSGGRVGYERVNDETCQFLDCGEKCYGYRESAAWLWLFRALSVLGLGLPYLVIIFYPRVRSRLTFIPCSLMLATVVLVKNDDQEILLCPVLSHPVRHFNYHFHRYIWNYAEDSFILLNGVEATLAELVETSVGLSNEQRLLRLEKYGPNRIPVKAISYLQLLIREILNPFYMFEILSIMLWIWDEYYQYAICVAIMSVVSIMIALVQLKKQTVMVRNMVVESDKDYCTVCDENGGFHIINSEDLVPGDVILIPAHGCLMTCDALLLSGTCIVNESVLTGESTPITKFPATSLDEMYDPSGIHSKHTLFCGTKVIQTRFYHNQVTALVVRTGAMTAKGQLIRSIIFPRPIGFAFYRDAVRFVLIMFVVSFIGCGFTLYLYIRRNAGLETILLRVLDVVTIVVPPTLPAATTVGVAYAQSRLKKQGIFCTSPQRINVAGKVKLVCFDKTGTITEEGLSVWGVLTPEGNSLTSLQDQVDSLPLSSPVLRAMATCHSLCKLEGKLSGDPLDIAMFNSTSWILEEPRKDETSCYDTLAPVVVFPDKNHYRLTVSHIPVSEDMDIQMTLELGIVKQFPFDSNVQRMSVITKQLGEECMTLYCKGAPEKIVSLCTSKSLPANLGVTLAYYTSSGFRVIVLAEKRFPRKFKWIHAQRSKREEVENDLTFLGILIMQNKLKKQSSEVIRQLNEAKIKCVMITGDNMLTAVSVSRDCGLIAPSTPMNQVIISAQPLETIDVVPINSAVGSYERDVMPVLAIDGPTWGKLVDCFPSYVPIVASRGVVFARMSPKQKAQIVEMLQSLDYVVAMVGDGANDCGALKTAHIGISLSAAEASIAAPFTSTTPDITCVPRLITESRCSLVTTFGLFNFMIYYSIIQFTSVLLLYERGIEMSTMEFLYVDLVVTGVLAIALGRGGPSKMLSLLRPVTALAAPANVVPLLLQTVLTAAMQYAALLMLQQQKWYIPVIGGTGDEEVVTCWENNVVFLVSCYQYIILAMICYKGPPHRESLAKNGVMVFSVIGLMFFNTYLLLVPPHEVTNFFELEPVTSDDLIFRATLISFPTLQLVLALLIEGNVAHSRWFKWVIHKITQKKQFKNKYKTIEKHIL